MTALAGLLAAFAAGCGSRGRRKLVYLGGGNGGQLNGLGLQPGAGQSAPYSPGSTRPTSSTMVDNRTSRSKPGTGFHYQGVAEDGKTPQTRRHGRHPPDEGDPGRQAHGRPRHCFLGREADREDLRLVRPGQAWKRLVHGRGHARARERKLRKSERLVGGRGERRAARDHHAGQPTSGRLLSPGVLPRHAERTRPESWEAAGPDRAVGSFPADAAHRGDGPELDPASPSASTTSPALATSRSRP